MNKKGFTLVELLSVILIIGALLLIIVPGVSKILTKSEDVIYDVQLNKILNATYDYTLKKITLLPEGDDVKYITLNELKANGFVDANIMDTKTNQEFPNDLVISIRNKSSNPQLDKNYIKKGDYIYKIEDETTIDKKPVFSFEDYEDIPMLDPVDIGDDYPELKCSANTFDNNNITEKVIKNITSNSLSVDEINTNRPGIYHIDYCVVDDEGNSGCARVSVIVKDTEPPTLEFYNVTINYPVKNYNLMDGVSCTDNSGNCDIEYKYIKYEEYNGELNCFYEYKAVDESGNTKTENTKGQTARIISITSYDKSKPYSYCKSSN